MRKKIFGILLCLCFALTGVISVFVTGCGQSKPTDLPTDFEYSSGAPDNGETPVDKSEEPPFVPVEDDKFSGSPEADDNIDENPIKITGTNLTKTHTIENFAWGKRIYTDAKIDVGTQIYLHIIMSNVDMKHVDVRDSLLTEGQDYKVFVRNGVKNIIVNTIITEVVDLDNFIDVQYTAANAQFEVRSFWIKQLDTYCEWADEKVLKEGDAWACVWGNFVPKVIEGDVYYITFKARTEKATDVQMSVDLFPDDLPQTEVSLSTKWQTFIFMFKINATHTEAQLRFFVEKASCPTNFYIKDVKIFEDVSFWVQTLPPSNEFGDFKLQEGDAWPCIWGNYIPTVTDGEIYYISFRAKTDRVVETGLGIDFYPDDLPDRTIYLSTQWQTFMFKFVIGTTHDNTRLRFYVSAGSCPTNYYISDAKVFKA